MVSKTAFSAALTKLKNQYGITVKDLSRDTGIPRHISDNMRLGRQSVTVEVCEKISVIYPDFKSYLEEPAREPDADEDKFMILLREIQDIKKAIAEKDEIAGKYIKMLEDRIKDK